MPLMTTTVRIRPGSDGSQVKWPDHTSSLRPTDDQAWRTKLGNKWMNDRGDAQPGMTYVIDQLPAGYCLFGKSREGSAHIDRYLCGHPKYKFRSPDEFYDHFAHLMDHGGDSIGCDCKGCSGRGTKKPRASNAISTPRPPSKSTPSVKPSSKAKPIPSGTPSFSNSSSSARPGSSSKPSPPKDRNFRPLPVQEPRPLRPTEPKAEKVDEEGTPDIWLLLVEELKDQGEIDKRITEPDSVDWCLEALSLAEHLQDIQRRPLWMPRVGELVLFVRNLSAGSQIKYDSSTKTFNIWNGPLHGESGAPAWEAGVIVELPQDDTSFDIADLTSERENENNMQVNYTGFRVEPMSEVGSSTKPWSTRSAYVPLHQMRPFNFWRELTKGIPMSERHPTINNAMIATSSFSLLHKYHFKGLWPNATVFVKAIYIGPEIILTGDIVRLLPSSDAGYAVTDVMKVTAIKMKLINLDGEETGLGDQDEDPPRWNTCVHISGVAYTMDATRAFGMGKLPLNASELPKGLAGYGSWYRLHDPAMRLEVPFLRVFGRCYEDTAIQTWFPTSERPTSSFATVNKASPKQPAADLSTGIEGVFEARAFSTANDPRIVRAHGKTWWWGESRVDQLDLHTMHGHDVGAHARFADGEHEGTLPRQAKHLDAMKKAKRAREKGMKGFKGEKSAAVAGLTKSFAASGMLAGGLNAVASDAQSEGEEIVGRKRGREDDDVEMGAMLRMSQIDQAEQSGDDMDDEDLVANQLVDELTGGVVMAVDAASPAKKTRVVVDLD